MDDDIHTDVTIRIILVGDSATGKTSLLLRYVDTKFSAKSVATVGIDFRTKILTFGSTVVKVQIFDTAGQERFHTITQAYYRNASGALIVFDVTNPSSYSNIYRWLTDMDSQAASAIKLIVGNKCDLDEARMITRGQAQKLADEVGCHYMEASAMTGHNVEEAFQSTIHAILLKKGLLPVLDPNSGAPLPSPRSRKSSVIYLGNPLAAQKQKEEGGGCC